MIMDEVPGIDSGTKVDPLPLDFQYSLDTVVHKATPVLPGDRFMDVEV
jgi:hypothetical protein